MTEEINSILEAQPISFLSLGMSKDLAAFVPESKAAASVFKDYDSVPITLSDDILIIPWGADNQMPYKIMKLIEADETMSTCISFSSETCFAQGLEMCTKDAENQKSIDEMQEFMEDNPSAQTWLGMCTDFAHYAMAIAIIHCEDGKIVAISRRPAAYCRISKADKKGRSFVAYANWRKTVTLQDAELTELLDIDRPMVDLRQKLKKSKAKAKYAILMKLPTAESTYYPIPSYASVFKSGWYDIKQIIAAAKKTKLKNSGSIKYQVQISNRYWINRMRKEGITDPAKQRARMDEIRREFVEFLSGSENSGKTLFTGFDTSPDGKDLQDVVITKIDDSKEGGDWASDIQEAVNMICFAMRVHSNLVGSVPGKSQTNNSGSDKRELYTIAQALKKPWREILFTPWKVTAKINGWKGIHPTCPIIQLTTLDTHHDIKQTQI